MRKFIFYLIILCLVWFPFQDIILSFFYRLYPSHQWRVLLVSKEILILFIITLLFIGKMLTGKIIISSIEVLSISYFLLCFFYLIFTQPPHVPTIATFTTFRSILLPLIFVLIGKWAKLNKNEFFKLIKIIIFISIISIIFGFIEMYLPVEKFWNGILNLHGYLTEVKGIQLEEFFVKNVPGNFWGFVNMRRMAGVFANPLTLGYYLILPIVFLFLPIDIIKRKKFILIFLIFGLFLTETRAAIIGTIIGIFLFYEELKRLLVFKIKKEFLVFLVIIFIFLISMLLFSPTKNLIVNTVTMREGRIIGHIEALRISLKNISETFFVGKGFGLAGGWGTVLGSKNVGAGESTYFSIIYQIGGIGLIIFLIWWFSIVIQLREIYANAKEDLWKNIAKIMICINIAYFLTGFISVQILTFTSVAHFWILTGAILGAQNK